MDRGWRHVTRNIPSGVASKGSAKTPALAAQTSDGTFKDGPAVTNWKPYGLLVSSILQTLGCGQTVSAPPPGSVNFSTAFRQLSGNLDLSNPAQWSRA